MLDNLRIRSAKIEDISTIYNFIKKIAHYEHLEGEVKITEKSLKESLFDKKYANALLCEVNKKPVAFVVFFYTFSTFTGKPTLYIEDIYVDEAYRRFGIGSKLFKYLSKLAKQENCGRIELSVLKWNKPAIAFYNKLGGQPLEEWCVYRFEEEVFINLCNE
jgi:GNAT superfamily N-acetyltransferase